MHRERDGIRVCSKPLRASLWFTHTITLRERGEEERGGEGERGKREGKREREGIVNPREAQLNGTL